MNVLYLGIENPIDISVPGVGGDKIRASMTNGTIGKGQVKNYKGEIFPGSWVATPTVENTIAQVVVSAEINGKMQQAGFMNFRVRKVPDPLTTFATITGDGEQTKTVLTSQQACFATLKDFDFDLRFTVTEFTLSFDDKGFNNSETSTSNRITDKQRTLLNQLTRGKKLYVEKVKAIGPDKKERTLNPVIIRVN